jgi:hypothetical protein
MLDCAKEALTVAEVAAPVDVVGHSQATLCQLALAEPEVVRNLVLVGAVDGAGGPPAGLVACPGAGRFMTSGAGALPSWPRRWPSGAATCGGSSGSSGSAWTPPSGTTAWSRWSGLSRATGGGRHPGGPAGRPVSARLTCDPSSARSRFQLSSVWAATTRRRRGRPTRDGRRPAGRPAGGLRALRPLPICGGGRTLHGCRKGLPPRAGSLGTAGAPAVLGDRPVLEQVIDTSRRRSGCHLGRRSPRPVTVP